MISHERSALSAIQSACLCQRRLTRLLSCGPPMIDLEHLQDGGKTVGDEVRIVKDIVNLVG